MRSQTPARHHLPIGFLFFRDKFAAIHTQLLPLQLKMMSRYTTRMRRSTKARYFMTIKLHRATKAKAERGMSQNEIHVPVSGVAGSGGVKGCLTRGATYRNTGAGAGAGGRRTLYRNQRHSVAGKRTPPESKQRWRDEHNCVEDEKTQSELGYLSPLVSSPPPLPPLLSSAPMADCLTSPRLFPLVAAAAHAQLLLLDVACQSWLTVCLLNVNKVGVRFAFVGQQDKNTRELFADEEPDLFLLSYIVGISLNGIKRAYMFSPETTSKKNLS